MVSGTFADNTGGKFATIIPSKLIVETINGVMQHEFIEKIYHVNGKLWQEKKRKGPNLCWEILSNFDKNGNPVEKGSLKNGNGTEYSYSEEGVLKIIFEYKNGLLVNEILPKK
jgi:antitoxin component YwqK of YwqJK toxin-antitoxin module